MRGISCPLILIKDDLFFRIHVARTVHPHITLGTGTAAIPVYQYRCLISLDDMIAVKQRMKVIIQNGEIFFSQPDHPVRHVLPGYGKAISKEFLFKAIKRDRVYVFSIHDRSSERSGYGASMKQAFWMFCFYHVPVCFAGIYTNMVLIHLDFCRNETISACNSIWKLFPSVFTEFCC